MSAPPPLRDEPRQLSKTRADDFPNLLLDLRHRQRRVDHPNAMRLARGELAVGGANRLVEMHRLLFHPVDPGGRTHPPKHPGARGRYIDVKEKGEIGPAVA